MRFSVPFRWRCPLARTHWHRTHHKHTTKLAGAGTHTGALAHSHTQPADRLGVFEFFASASCGPMWVALCMPKISDRTAAAQAAKAAESSARDSRIVPFDGYQIQIQPQIRIQAQTDPININYSRCGINRVTFRLSVTPRSLQLVSPAAFRRPRSAIASKSYKCEFFCLLCDDSWSISEKIQPRVTVYDWNCGI